MHPADEGGGQAKVAQARQRVGDGAAGRLNAVFHGAVEHLSAVFFNQLHDAFLNPHQLQKSVIGGGEDIDNGISDADDVIFLHVLSS